MTDPVPPAAAGPPTPEDLARDAAADLAVCDAATGGPWVATEGAVHQPEGRTTLADCTWPGACAENPAVADTAAFIALARTALPAWIKRAAKAEAERDAIRAENATLKQAIGVWQGKAELDDGHWVPIGEVVEHVKGDGDGCPPTYRDLHDGVARLLRQNAALRARLDALTRAGEAMSVHLTDFAGTLKMTADDPAYAALAAWDVARGGG